MFQVTSVQKFETAEEALEAITLNTVEIAQVEGENVIQRSAEDIQNIVTANLEKAGQESEVKTEKKQEEVGEQSQPEVGQIGAAAEEGEEDLKGEESTEGQPEGQVATEGQEIKENTEDQQIAEGETAGEEAPAQTV